MTRPASGLAGNTCVNLWKSAIYGCAMSSALLAMNTACASQGLSMPVPAPLKHSCKNPSRPQAYNAYIDSTIPSDLDPYLAVPPTPTTRIYFSILVPERCPGETFPVVYNQAAWGMRRIEHVAVGTLLPERAPEVLSEVQLMKQLPYYGYVLISVDPRGLAESVPANGGGTVRLIDPAAEIQDARQVLDWAYDHAADYGIQTEPNSGIAKDIKVGTYGLSYGGGFQMSLAALDPRIDTIIPSMTWNDIMYTIVPGQAIKLGWGGLLCASGSITGMKYTPELGMLCKMIGPTDPKVSAIRTLHDLTGYLGDLPGQVPTPEQAQRQAELMEEFGTTGVPPLSDFIDLLEHPGMAYFASQQAAGLPWGFGETEAKLRPVPALFIQGNDDLLFNLTEGYWNYKYFSAAGGDTRLMSTNGGHDALLSPETGYCGPLSLADATMAWFNHYLKGMEHSGIENIPRVCISVSDTVGAPHTPNVAVKLADFPAGSLSGTGAVPAKIASMQASVSALQANPTFVSITTIRQSGAVLAGAPTVGSLTVTRGRGAMPVAQVVAFIATGIKRGDQLIAVDQQVTGFAEGTHTHTDDYVNQEDHVTLPAVGEQLQPGDEVGLLFYPQTYAFSALTGLQSLADAPLLLEQVSGFTTGTRALAELEKMTGLTYINPYSIDLTDVELPILVPGRYAGSQLVKQPPAK